jgi:sugar phosphate isomerase/epimerase
VTKALEYYRGDFPLSLQSFSFHETLRDGAAGRPGGLSMFEFIEWAATQGVAGVELGAYYFPGYHDRSLPENLAAVLSHASRVRKKCEDRGLVITGTGLKNDFTQRERAERELDVARTNAWIEVAAALGAPVVRVFSGFVPEGYEDRWDETAKWMADCFARVAEHGKAFGVKVGVQNHGDSLATAEQVIRVMKMVGHDHFGVVDDTGFFRARNAQSGADYDWYADIAAVLPYALNFLVKNRPGGRESRVPMDLQRLFTILRSSAYRGPVTIEYLLSKAEARSYAPTVRVPQFLAQIRRTLELTKNAQPSVGA